MPEIIRIIPSDTNGEKDRIPQERRIEGDPEILKDVQFVNEKANFVIGIWGCGNGKFQVDYPVDEFIYVIKGTAILTDEGGKSVEINAGDSVAVPAGFKGTWETVGEVQKYYAQLHHK